jgi:heterodisulfide reductase subunit C
MDHTPRFRVAMIRAGMRDAVLTSNTPWMCVSCHFCVVRCPQDVHITDVMYALKGMASRSGQYPDAKAPEFSRVFVDNIRTYGRSFEMGLVMRHYLRHQVTRLPGMAPMGIGMLARGRVGLTPHRIKGIKGLRAVLARAEHLEAME